MFDFGKIWAFPTDTSFGLGVRADDFSTLEKLAKLKKRKSEQKFSLMVRDFEMLKNFAEVPADFPENFFTEKPRTAILKPTQNLPKSKFWPEDSVAFRVCTIPEIAEKISFPITATSANLSGDLPIFSTKKLRENFGDRVQIFEKFPELPERSASEIWDFTESRPKRLR